MSQEYNWPSSGTLTIAAVGPNGNPIPSESILIAGEDPTGDLTPVQVDASGNLIVTPAAGALHDVNITQVLGAAPSATNPLASRLTDGSSYYQGATQPTLVAMSAKLPAALGQTTMAASLSVAIASNQSAVPISAASLPLPSGAATEATLSTLNGKVTACNTGAVVVSSSALPTGASTEATQSSFSAKSGSSDVTVAYDYRAFTYVGATQKIDTIVYKTGGSGGSVVATQTFGYDGSDRLTSITKS